jgi:hypothetical protein
MAAWFRWKQWDWAHHPEVVRESDGFVTEWPTASEIKLGQGLAPQENERESKNARYTVELVYEAERSHRVEPRTLEEFQRYDRAECTLRIHDSGQVEVLSGPTPPRRRRR